MPDPRVELRLTARDQTQAAFASVRRGLGSLDSTISSLRAAVLRLGPAFAAVGAGISVAAFARFVRSGIDVADQLNTISKRTGVAVEDLSVLKFAAEQTETNFEALTTGLQKFEVKLAKAGISGNQTIAMLLGLADHFQKTESSTKRMEEAVAIFGKAVGPELVPFLSQGSTGINELIQKLRDMNGVITGETAAAADEFKDQIAALGTQITAFAANLAGPVLKNLNAFLAGLNSGSGKLASMQSEIGNINTLLVEEDKKLQELEGEGWGALEFLDRHRIKVLTDSRKELLAKRKALFDEAGKLNLDPTAPAPPSEVAKILPGAEKAKRAAAKAAKDAAKAATDAAKALIEASLAATQDALEREQRNLDQALEEELVSFRDFYARRTAIALAGIDAEIAAKREALAVAKDQGDVARITSEITVLERKRGDVAVQARRDQINAERELADQLAEVRARVLEAEGRTAEATRIRLEAEFGELTARLQIEGDTAGVELVKRLFNIEAARGQLTQLQAEFDRLREQLARDETRVHVEVDTGLQTELAGRREIVRLHTETAAKLDPIIDKMRIIAQTIGPEEISRVAGLAAEVDNLDIVTNEVAQSLNNEFKNAAGSAFADFLRGTKTAQQAFADFGDAVLDAIARIAAENIAESLFGDLFKAGKKGGSAGGGFGDLLSLFGSLFHQGGIAGAPGPGRRIPALAFAGAPRLHDGGMLGLRRDEVPAILQRGEEVLTRGDPRHRANQGGEVKVIMNITTPDVQGFRRSSGQIAVEASMAIGRAARNRP
jgi:hypothetical protein